MTLYEQYHFIAKELAINYFNVSLRKDNVQNEDSEYCKAQIGRIFTKKSEIDYKVAADFSRNILIIGAGASKGYIGSMMGAEEAINFIEDDLKFKELLKINYINSDKETINLFEKQYKSLASHYFKTVYSDTPIEKIQDKLKFEGRLSLLLNFYNKQDILNEIKKILDFQFLTNRFYEVVAHLFKHRFIDVIVNFNFDELLDNAIDDEIGSAFYHRIVHDSDCKPIKDIMEKNRLRTPIYIKPHGSLSSKTSMLFTKEHYIDMSEDMKELLHNIFMGKVGDEKKNIEFFNILVAGFSMESVELEDILFNQLKRKTEKENKIEKITYHIFSDRPNDIHQGFKSKFELFCKETLSDQPSHPGWPEINEFECNKDKGLAEHFEYIYKLIINKFEKPFQPVGLFLHDALSILFPSQKINEIGKELLTGNREKYQKYLKNRFIFHLLYDIVKLQGRLALNAIVNERPGKYYHEYLMSFKEEKEILKIPDILGELSLVFGNEKLEPYNDLIYELNPFRKELSNVEKDDTEKNSLIDKFICDIGEKMIFNSLIGSSCSEDDRTKLKHILLSIYDSAIYEINPMYYDPKHIRFNPFPKEQIILTSLALTHKFFEYSVLRGEEWDKLWFSSDSATPIFNLHRYCSRDIKISHLEKIKIDNKTLAIIYSDDKKRVEVDPVTLRQVEERGNRTLIEINDQISKKLESNFEKHLLESRFNNHHMALFLKNGNPIFGFYFFKPDSKNRINPVYFESKFGENDRSNLKKLKDLFTRQKDRAMRWKEYTEWKETHRKQ